MAERKTYDCNVCGIEKRESNHWFVVLRGANGVTVITHKQANDAHLRCNLRQGDELFDTCGEQCTLVKVSEFLRAPYPMPERAAIA